ncbi:hypothetical protein HOF40_04345 [Candidatus Parcubacteria bacterium]|jgi:hypothetical protein|nr:hypothetical protein [Candidatus Parcubacteria bacterium]MBT3949293.1 hypothetical protein [Candidatus Parcubacteria bacterium]
MSKSTWDPRLAKVYRTMPPPGPPSKSELKIYERFVKNVSKQGSQTEVLILGSTPGLRDLCVKYHLKYTCVDYHKENYRIAKTAMKYRNEDVYGSLVVSDWKKMKLDKKFDLILGDIASGVTPFKDWNKLWSVVSGILKDNAICVHRTWMRKKGHFKNFEKFLKGDYARRRKTMHPFTSLTIPFIHYFYNKESESVLFSQNLPKLKIFVDKGLLQKKDFDKIDYFFGHYKIPNYFPLKSIYEKKLKDFFVIKNILKGTDWFKDYSLIYILKKK